MKVGDWVQVKGEEEILSTLDPMGTLEGMPFMPEMLPFCGQVFRVYKKAHKSCDSMNRRSRRLRGVVHLDTRCSGNAHDGCGASCLLFWKEAWLQPLNTSPSPRAASLPAAPKSGLPPTREDLLRQCISQQSDGLRYRCQATQLRQASTPLPWWDLRQYVEDLRSGNVTWHEFRSGSTHAAWMALAEVVRPKGLVHWCYEHLRFLWRGAPFPRRVGSIPVGQRTPVAALGLTPGELVRIRSLEEIDRTLDSLGRNRGLYFDPEQAAYATGTFRVLQRVERMINEESGAMLELKTPAIVLDSLTCQGQYSRCRMFCPRNAYLLWHEAWLKRVQETETADESAWR